MDHNIVFLLSAINVLNKTCARGLVFSRLFVRRRLGVMTVEIVTFFFFLNYGCLVVSIMSWFLFYA